MNTKYKSTRTRREKAKDVFFVLLAALIIGGLLGYSMYGVWSVIA